MKERMYYPINEEMARLSHDMMSMSDYQKGSKTEAYKAYVDEAYDLVEQIEVKKPRYADKAYNIAKAYARRLADNMNKESRIGTMCPSVMISGAGNFPVKKKEKQVAAWDDCMREFKEIQEYKRKLDGMLHGTIAIRSDDEDAIVQLEEKLSSLEEMQELMKSVNAYYRKHKTLKGCPEFTEEQAAEIEAGIEKSWDKKPFPSYTITNNGANIRRVKDRIETLKKEKSRETSETKLEDLELEVVENVEDMRLQLFFEDKPDEDVRDMLKSNGFKWSRTNGCWQRQLTDNARYATKKIINKLRERSAEV